MSQISNLVYRPLHKKTGRLVQPTGGLGAFGLSNAISGNGNWLAVGAPSFPFEYLRTGGIIGRVGAGTVTVYKKRETKCSTEWELIQNFTGPDENNFTDFPPTVRSGPHSDFGFSVALNQDGRYLAIAGAGDDQIGFLDGAVWIYIRNDDTGFYEYSQKIVPVIPGQAQFAIAGAVGYGITINDVGDLIAVGLVGLLNGNFDGGVVVFRRTGNKWSQLLMEGKFYIPPPSDVTITSEFGSSVKFDACGKHLVIGALNDNNGVGSAYVFIVEPVKNELRLLDGTIEFKESSTDITYRQFGGKFVGSPTTTTQDQGFPVTISKNAKYIAIYGSDTVGEAKVYVFKKSPGQYTQTNVLSLGVIGQGSDPAKGQDQTGGLHFNENGRILAVGIPSSVSGQGSIRIYYRKNGVFNLIQTITDPNSDPDAHQGTSVALSDNGSVLAFGGGSEKGSKGSAFVWTSK